MTSQKSKLFHKLFWLMILSPAIVGLPLLLCDDSFGCIGIGLLWIGSFGLSFFGLVLLIIQRSHEAERRNPELGHSLSRKNFLGLLILALLLFVALLWQISLP